MKTKPTAPAENKFTDKHAEAKDSAQQVPTHQLNQSSYSGQRNQLSQRVYCQKICLIGASAVGKTSLIRNFVDGIFSDKYLTTIGVKIDKHQVDTDKGEVQLLIWDIEGTDQFCGFNTRYLNGANAYIVVLDQSRPSSANDALTLLSLAKNYSSAPAYLAINKSDLSNQLSYAQQSLLEGAGFVQIIHTSAKTGDQVAALFRQVAEQQIMG